MANYLNTGSDSAPSLRVYLNADTLADAPAGSYWPDLSTASGWNRLAADGFEGVQWTGKEAVPEPCPLPYCGLDRINAPDEAEAIIDRHAQRGDECVTVHLGWGMESDTEMDALVGATLDAGQHHGLPVFIETHRATVTQDIWRTVQLAMRFPQIRFNGDFSHYYCGQELVYGDFEQKLRFMAPIFERVGFMHGRVAAPGWMQAPVAEDAARPREATGEVDYWAHFRMIWLLAMEGFLAAAGPGDVLIFAPELLSGRHYYARLFPDGAGGYREECDRYQQALRYAQVARELFAQAGARQAQQDNGQQDSLERR